MNFRGEWRSRTPSLVSSHPSQTLLITPGQRSSGSDLIDPSNPAFASRMGRLKARRGLVIGLGLPSRQLTTLTGDGDCSPLWGDRPKPLAICHQTLSTLMAIQDGACTPQPLPLDPLPGGHLHLQRGLTETLPSCFGTLPLSPSPYRAPPLPPSPA